jgi:hypothetical protein
LPESRAHSLLAVDVSVNVFAQSLRRIDRFVPSDSRSPTHAAANRVIRCPAQSFSDIAAKARVHRVWEFDGDDINHIMADIARVAGKGGAV